MRLNAEDSLFVGARILNSVSRLRKEVSSPNLPMWLISRVLCVVACATLFGPGSLVQADITLPPFFSDHMVIQQAALFPVVGTAEPHQNLMIRFNDSEVKTTAGADGKFSAALVTPAAGGPFTIEIADENEANKVVLTDVMVGDVWLCVGQASMGQKVSELGNEEPEISLAQKCNQIRLLQLAAKPSQQPSDDILATGPWATCSPENVKDFSALAYFFGDALSQKLDNVPIGLVQASVANSTCEMWCSMSSMEEVEALGGLLEHWRENEDPEAINRPGTLFNGVVAPLTSYPFKGVIWYQGEGNLGRGKQYGELLPCLIADWRKNFDSPGLPFYMVQLPPHRYANFPEVALPELWDAQLKTVRNVPATGMIPTMDMGGEKEKGPAMKRLMGRRLAVLALADTYKMPPVNPDSKGPVPETGPTFESVAYRGKSIFVTFQHTGDGLELMGDGEQFAICGADEVFHPARVKIIGPATIELSSALVEQPRAVRYCWSDQATPAIANRAGLPAFPFRSDSFALESEDAQF